MNSKNTGNPNDPNGVQFELSKGGGDKSHADDKGGGNQPQIFKAAGTTSGNNKIRSHYRLVTQELLLTEGDDDLSSNLPH